MKYIFTSSLFLAITALLSAQSVNDMITTGPGYANQVWYSMANGEVGISPKDNWDLAFEIPGFSASIRYNEQKGMELYAAPYTITEWSDIDTTGMAANWTLLHNHPKAWDRGAFNQFTISELDLGWGTYNMVTHIISGDSIYIVKLANGDFKKLRIDNLASGTYNFTYANIDGTSETSGQIVKSDFAGKNFGYFNLETNESVYREPNSSSWDITFTKYMELVGPDADTPYGVTGVLQNYATAAAKAADTPIDQANPYDFSYSTDINIIGYDWKVFDFTLGYIIEEDLSYFIQGHEGNIYQMVLTEFEGSATGIYEFGVEVVGSVGISEIEEPNLNTYPNPTNGEMVQITWESGDFDKIILMDLSGKMVMNKNILFQSNATEIQTNHLTPGIYILQLSGGNAVVNQKLVVTQ